ncbi:MAG: hypothetical protein K2L25_02245 [Alphaproteobacteria bacterium]|nr:hypothetical protein [Alphaproteobacteria bacterium]
MIEAKRWLPEVVDGALGEIPTIGSMASNAFGMWRKKNVDVAREILLTNIRQGDVESIHKDELFSMLSRFSRSVQEGLAKSNLILMARLISGVGRVDKENGKAETFSQYASTLETLTYEEIVFLAECIKKGGVVAGKEELKQSLQQKGLFVWAWHASISNKIASFEPSFSWPWDNTIPKVGDAWRATEMFSRNIFGEPQKKQEPIPYEVNTSVVYRFSEKLNHLLETYGDLWEDLSRWTDKKDIDNE